MKKIMLSVGFTALVSAKGFSQGVAINTDGGQAHASAMLDVRSVTKGLLTPRMTAAERTSIATPAMGLLVYQYDGTPGFYYYSGTAWQQISTAANALAGAWSLTGNTGTDTAVNYIGTADAANLRVVTNKITRMTVTKSGNVGIGYNNPSAVLDVRRGSNGADQPTLKIEDYISSSNNGIATVSLYNQGSYPLISGSTIGPGTMLRLKRTNNGALANGLEVSESGTGAAVYGENTNPSGKGGQFAGNNATGTGIIATGNKGVDITATTQGIDVAALSNSTGLYVSTTGIYAIASNVSEGGSVIGMWAKATAPANTGFKSAFLGEGNCNITGSYYTSSDRKLKQNIQPLSGSLDKLMQLKPSSYQYKTTDYKIGLPEGTQMGFVAQELQTVFPELVQQQIKPEEKNKKGEVVAAEVKYLGVNYTGLIPVTISAIQEQQQTIQTLKTENAELKKEMAALKAKLGL